LNEDSRHVADATDIKDEYTTDGSYLYKERHVEPMPEREFRFGEGKISGYASCALGILAILAVLCYRYPEYLTTPELRAAYDADVLRSNFQGVASTYFNGPVGMPTLACT
jgi:hypothetical protein